MPLQELDASGLQEVAPQQAQAAAPQVQEITGVTEELPAYASGSSPEMPINKSPVDIMDRFRYSLGNEKGIEADLKTKFPEGVQKDSHGNYTIKKEGLWYRADPKGLGDGDSWERTKELMADAADIAPQLIKNAAIGGALGGRAAGISGAIGGAVAGLTTTAATDAYSEEISNYVKDNPMKSMAAATILGAVGLKGVKAAGLGGVTKEALPAMLIGSGAEAARTSLGRLAGTYDATNWEQARDIGYESLMNLGGAAVAAGVKPTGQALVNSVRTAAKGFSEAPEMALGLAKAVHGNLSGIGDMNIENMAKFPNDVPNILDAAVSGSKTNEAAVRNIILDQVNDTKRMLREVQPALSRQYVSMSKNTVESVPKDFVGSPKELVQSTWAKAANMGLGTLRLVEGEGNTPEIVGFKAANDGGLATAAAKLLKAGRSQDAEMVQGLIGNEDAKNYLGSFFKTIGAHAASEDQEGVLGARSLVGFKKAISSRVEDLKSQASKDGINSVRGILNSLDGHLDSAIEMKFQPKDGSPNLFTQFNNAYKQMKGAVQPLLDVRDAAANQGTDQPYLSLINQVSSDARSGLLKRSAFHELATQKNPVTGEALFDNKVSDIYQKFLNRESAKAFIPVVKPGVLGEYGPTGAIAMGAMNPKAGIAMGAGLLATSPRLAGKMVLLEQSVARFLQNKDAAVRQFINNTIQQTGDVNAPKVVVDMGFKGLKLTQALAESGRSGELMKNEQAMKAYAQTLLNGFTGVYKMQNQLMSNVPKDQ